jgi:aminoglycoside 2'-N-acetyltransferase I
MPEVRLVETRHLAESERRAIRQLMDEAFEGDFTEDDWQHALGGWHAIIADAARVVAHAAVVARRLFVSGQWGQSPSPETGPVPVPSSRGLRAGYVEAVAVRPSLQRRGLGTAVMMSITDLVRQHFELGALSSGEWGFYERLGWERWRGPTFVLTPDGQRRRSAEDDDGIMVLRCQPTGDVDVTMEITCEVRTGDSW